MLELSADCLNATAICAHIAIANARGGPNLGRIVRGIVQELHIINIAHEAASELCVEVIARLLDDISSIHSDEYLLNLAQVPV